MAVKVLHIIKSLGRGGAEMLLPETLTLHRRDLFEFHYIYFLPWKDQMVASIQKHGGKVCCFDARNNFFLMTKVWQVARYVRHHNIQLIHAHLPWAGILARVVGKLTGIPVVYTEHNKQERYHTGTRLMNLATMNLLREVIAVSSDVADSIRRSKPNLRIPMSTVLNGVNVESFSKRSFDNQPIRDKLRIPGNVLLIGTIAVFRFQKRLGIWMELAVEILKQREDVHFVIVGDGPLKEDLKRKRDLLGLSERIHMPGLETEVRPYLAAFDLYMMTSLFEGLPVALLEAMAMECPVITTNAGGIKEVIRHEVDGLLCSVDDPKKLVGYASTLLNDAELRLKYGKAARQRVIEAFSMEKMVGELEGVYRDVVGRGIRNKGIGN